MRPIIELCPANPFSRNRQCDASYKRKLNSLVEKFFLVYEKFLLDFAKNRKIRNSKSNPETTSSVENRRTMTH